MDPLSCGVEEVLRSDRAGVDGVLRLGCAGVGFCFERAGASSSRDTGSSAVPLAEPLDCRDDVTFGTMFFPIAAPAVHRTFDAFLVAGL
jgi:hypothetical protein